MSDPGVAASVLERVRWELPELADSEAVIAWRKGDAGAAAVALIGQLRRRPAPDLGFAPAYGEWVREHAGEPFRAEARRQIDTLLTWGPLVMRHFGLGPLQPEMLLAEGTHEDYRRFARTVESHRDEWGQCDWGCSHTIFRYLQTVWREPRCEDRALVPVLAWLLDRVEAEWRRARGWAEDLLGTSGHNWWVCQFAGFWKAGVFLPEFKGWMDFAPMAADHLRRELDLLFTREGFSREGSLLYHLVAVAVLQDWVRLSRLNGIPLPAEVDRRLSDFARLEAMLLTPDGKLPALGDGTMATAPAWCSQRLFHWSAVVQSGELGAVARMLAPAVPRAMMSGEFLFTCLGEVLAPSVGQGPVPPLDAALEDSGLYVMRQGWTSQSDYLLIDAITKGEVVSSHAHDGALHLQMYSRGTPVLVDGGGGWQHDVSTDHVRVRARSHNVATVDEQDHCGIRAEFRFERVVRPRVEEWISASRYAYFSGVHEAYARPEVGVAAVRRKVFYLRGEYAILLDRFTVMDDRTHVYAQHFHLGVPAERISGTDDLRTLGSAGNLRICPVSLSRGTLVTSLEAHPEPMPDEPNPLHAKVSLSTAGHAVMATVLVPFTGGALPVVQVEALPVEADGRVLSPWEATGLAITVDGRRDLYVDWHMAWSLPWRIGGVEGSDRLYHSSLRLDAMAGTLMRLQKCQGVD